MPHGEKKEGVKLNGHDHKVALHREDHASKVQEKEAQYTHKHERHSGTGHALKESPKKGGGGSGTVWGTYNDDIKDLKASGVIA